MKNRIYPGVTGVALFISFLLIIINIFADHSYEMPDLRIGYTCIAEILNIHKIKLYKK